MANGTVRIGIYRTIKDTAGAKEIDINVFLDHVREGKWQDLVLPIRAIEDHDERQKIKRSLPNVTISGTFSERKDTAIKVHSGYIAIDLDGLDTDVEGVHQLMASDPYVYACFTSVSGRGLCVIFPIDGSKHREAFEGIAGYLREQYQLIVDPSGKNESRARYASYDPDLHHNPKALKFKKYPPKPKVKKLPPAVYVEDDFGKMVNELAGKNICEDYHDWISIGYALAAQFHEGGRSYYHTLSAPASKYDPKTCDWQYNVLLSSLHDGKSKKSTLGTIFYFARLHNIPFYSDQTKKILSSTTTLKRSGLDQAAIVSNIFKFEGLTPDVTAPIVQQAIDNKVEFEGEDSVFCQIENWMKYNYEFRRNEITRYIEDRGRILKQKDFNTIFIACKKVIEPATYEMIERLINSDFTPEYNPIIEFFQSHIDRAPTGIIDELFSTIQTTDPVFACRFGKKWLVSAISSIHGEHSPLMLVLSGELQGTGKTEFLRRMVPAPLRPYYAESKLEAGKDDEILMTQKLFIMDDEMGGKNKKEEKRIKELLSKQTFSLREPYGRNNVDLNRIAVLCGTTNDRQILNDPTGNRRILPIPVISIDHAAYNKIDKIDLFMEAYHLWKSGYDWRLSREEVDLLSLHGDQFQSYTIEYELILKYFRPNGMVNMTATEIKVHIERQSQQKISLDRLGKELQRIGYEQHIKYIDGKTKRVYSVDLLNHDITPITPENKSGVRPLNPPQDLF